MAISELEKIETDQEWNQQEHELLWEAASFVRLVVDTNQMTVAGEFPTATGDIQANCSTLNSYLTAVRDEF